MSHHKNKTLSLKPQTNSLSGDFRFCPRLWQPAGSCWVLLGSAGSCWVLLGPVESCASDSGPGPDVGELLLGVSSSSVFALSAGSHSLDASCLLVLLFIYLWQPSRAAPGVEWRAVGGHAAPELCPLQGPIPPMLAGPPVYTHRRFCIFRRTALASICFCTVTLNLLPLSNHGP